MDKDTIARLRRIGEAGRLLYIYPSANVSPEPLVDSLTRKMTAAFRAAEETGVAYRGFHECACGVFSANTDWYLPGEIMINSLCVHYLAWHRDEVPDADLEYVAGLHGEAEPSQEELNPPKRRNTWPNSRF